MKAVVIANPGRGADAWAEKSLPDPVAGPGQVVVRVRAASLNYRDLAMARGHYGGPLKKDLVPLADAAGEVVSVGPGVTRWKGGEQVIANYFPSWRDGVFSERYFADGFGQTSVDGVLAELVAIPEGALVEKPAHLSFEEAATLPCAALTAWNALFENAEAPTPGTSVLVLGTGGVSVFAAQLALASGMRVIGTTSSREKAGRLRGLGVADVIDYRATPEWHEEVLRLTNGEGVDHVIEVGGAGTLERSLRAVKSGGTVSLIGMLTGVQAEVNPFPILVRGIRLQGVLVGSVAMFERMNRAVARMKLKPVVDAVFPISEASRALAKLDAASHFGKIVVAIP